MRYSALGLGPVQRSALLLLNNQSIAKQVFEAGVNGAPVACSETAFQALRRIRLLGSGGQISPGVHVVSSEAVKLIENLARPQLDTYRDRALAILEQHRHVGMLGRKIAEYTTRGHNLSPIVFMAFLADIWVNELVQKVSERPYLERGQIILTDYTSHCREHEWYGIREDCRANLTTVFLWDLVPVKAAELLSIVDLGSDGFLHDSRFFLVDAGGQEVLEQVRARREELAEPILSALRRHASPDVPWASILLARLFMKEMSACLAMLGMIDRPWCRMAVFPHV